jgi:hypothetical protein
VAIHPLTLPRKYNIPRHLLYGSYADESVKDVLRGVHIERLFILSRSKAIDSTSGKLEPSLAVTLEKQARDGINVQVVWEETIDSPELI